MSPDLAGPAPIGPDPVEVGPDWWDLFIGVKTNNAISANWEFSFYGALGHRLGLGIRVRGFDYSKNQGVMDQYTKIDATFYGFLIGYEFN
jgi:hypothetical protein